MKAHQLANYADACNECGNCDIFCPEDGGPQREKPRFFGSLETYQKHAGPNGFFIDWETGAADSRHDLRARVVCLLTLDPVADRAWFDTASDAEVEIRPERQPVAALAAQRRTRPDSAARSTCCPI